jgi:NAD(P)-dependent dehydrogenase (short-subunit alcohol dehydrogenase family)
MDLRDARFMVAGATGALGSRLALALQADGARVFLAGRDIDRLGELADQLGAPAGALDLSLPMDAVNNAVDVLGGLDGLVIATGAVAFAAADELPDGVARELFEVNALGPVALIRAALGELRSPAAIVALSAVVAEFPTAGMAAYSASKAALSAYLGALRRERRRHGLTVLDVRPPHLDTDFSAHALHGDPPKLPEPADPDALVTAILDAVRDDRRELRYDPTTRELIAQ